MGTHLTVNQRSWTGFIFSQKKVDIDKNKIKLITQVKLMNSVEICI